MDLKFNLDILRMKILLDTNFLLLPPQRKVDIYNELAGHELVTLESCMKELEKIAASGKKDASRAKAALLLAKGRVEVLGTKWKGDRAIVNYAVENKCGVATNDRELIKSLKRHNIRIFRLRQRKYIVKE